jgi:hypothetical protein
MQGLIYTLQVSLLLYFLNSVLLSHKKSEISLRYLHFVSHFRMGLFSHWWVCLSGHVMRCEKAYTRIMYIVLHKATYILKNYYLPWVMLSSLIDMYQQTLVWSVSTHILIPFKDPLHYHLFLVFHLSCFPFYNDWWIKSLQSLISLHNISFQPLTSSFLSF